ncbi:MAG TPA: hypothetical protein VJT31_31305 [Rugosimonospora sp.]|nr:hypothetical protein [Rugosimonospora sp.]
MRSIQKIALAAVMAVLTVLTVAAGLWGAGSVRAATGAARARGAEVGSSLLKSVETEAYEPLGLFRC